MKYSNQKINHIELDVIGTVYGVSPVQAEGTVHGLSFYFRARHDEWTFSVSENPEIDPVDIQTIEAGESYGFFKECSYGGIGAESASYMDFQTAENIIIDCCAEYRKITNKV
tara:strand:+ start:22 stop:357 length:336 start_codon:yes stop_codon:yes gene_type:complete